MHKIIPIYKKGDKLNVANYRPISLLCILEKVLETLIYQKVIPFLQPQLSRNQFGFSKNSSCVMNLLKSYTEIYNSINQGHSMSFMRCGLQVVSNMLVGSEQVICIMFS